MIRAAYELPASERNTLLRHYISRIAMVLLTATFVSFGALAQDLDYAVEAYQADDYAEALPVFQELADAGDDDAMWYLAKLYDHGWGVDQSDALALKWFTKSADLGDPDSMWEVGIFYETGQGIEVNQKTAFKWYLQSAEGGLAKAMTEVGMRYENGNGVRASEKKAFKWYLRGAEAGHAAGQAYAGFAYEFGQGVRASESDAVYWYSQAAAQENPDGLAWLGEMYEAGTGVDQDLDFARELYRKASALGNDYAAGRLEAIGDGGASSVQASTGYTPADYSDEKCDYDLEIEDMKPDCQYGIAVNMVQGLNAYDSAQPILERLATQYDHTDSAFLLGVLYSAVEDWHAHSMTDAFKWHLQAADNGHPESQGVVGSAYIAGAMGAEKDQSLGLSYTKKAARAGHKISQDFLDSQGVEW